MLRALLTLLFMAIMLGAAVNDADVLRRADRLLGSGEKTEVFRAYNDYKNVYLRAMLHEDTRLREKALKGIVKSGKILHIDVSRYEDELRGSASSAVADTPVKQPAAKSAGGRFRTLQEVYREGERLLLDFDGRLSSRDVNYFKLYDTEQRRYRYIFDIHARLGKGASELQSEGLRRIALSQHKPGTLRLVVENDAPLDIRFKRERKSLAINLGVGVGDAEKPLSEPMVSRRTHLREARWEDGGLLLRFDRPLDAGQIGYSKLLNTKAHRYRYIFNLDNAMLDRQYDLRHQQLKRISLAQFDSKTLRLVIENDTPLQLTHRTAEGGLFIDLGVRAVQHPDGERAAATGGNFNKVIVLDPGHGGKDTGAIGHKKYREKVVVMQITKELSKLLTKLGYKVYMTRTGDRFIKLQKRTEFANRKNADLFISIHANAVPKRNVEKAYGIETYFLSNDDKAGSERAKRVAAMENSKDLQDVTFYGQQDFINILNREKIKMSERLAYDLQRNVLANLRKGFSDVKDGGVREGPFWILVGAQMPAVLVEVGFITHPKEAQRLVNRTYQKRFAEGLANGINQYFINNP